LNFHRKIRQKFKPLQEASSKKLDAIMK